VHGAQKVLSKHGFRMAKCFCCLSQNAMVCFAHCRQDLQQKSWKKLQDFFFKTETKTKTKCSRPRPRLHDPRPRPRPRLSFLSSRRLETKTLVLRTTSLVFGVKFLQDSKKNKIKIDFSQMFKLNGATFWDASRIPLEVRGNPRLCHGAPEQCQRMITAIEASASLARLKRINRQNRPGNQTLTRNRKFDETGSFIEHNVGFDLWNFLCDLILIGCRSLRVSQ